MEMIAGEVKQLAIQLFKLSMEVTEKTEYDCICEFQAPANRLNIRILHKDGIDYDPLISYSIDLNEEPDFLSETGNEATTANLLTRIKQKLFDLLAPANA